MPLVQNPSIGAGGAPLLFTSVTLSSAQILALLATPVQLVPAPGAGFLTVVISMALVYKFGTTKYSATADQLIPAYLSQEDGVIAQNPTNMLIVPAHDVFQIQPGNTAGNDTLLPGDDNQPISMFASASYNVGPILTTTLGAGGLGYVANDTGTITTGNGDATYKVLTVGAGGAVLTYQITAPGTLYATGNGVATATGGAQPGVGVGFTVNITAVTLGDGTLRVVTYYQIIPVP